MAELNPIERRLGMLREQYRGFIANERARLMRWVLAEDERRMMDAFVQTEAIGGETEDLLLLLDSPFGDPARYGMDLVAELAEIYDALRETLADAGVADTRWRPPPPQPGSPPDVAYLRQTAASFHEHHQPLLRHLSLLLQPRKVSDPQAFATWLGHAVNAWDDPRLRLVLIERAEYPAAEAVVPAEPVHRVEAELDMPAALEELNEAAGVDGPEGQFRQAYLKMGNAMGRKDLAAAEQHAGRAVQLAEAQKWPHLVIATHSTLATGQMGAGRHREAMDGFRRADAVAQRSHDEGEPWAQQLMLQSRLGQGSVCVAAGSWGLGAQTYAEQALPVARAMEDLRMQLECLRMAAYCNEQQEQIDAAWDQNVAALAVGDQIPPAERRTTTLAYVGEALLRLCQHRSRRGQESVVHHEMRRLLGPDWRAQAQPGEPPEDIEPSPLESSPPKVATVPEELSQPVPVPQEDPAGGSAP